LGYGLAQFGNQSLLRGPVKQIWVIFQALAH